jgi:hypothetical protein
MVSLARRRLARPWYIPLPWTGKLGMALALAYILSVVLFVH